VPFYGTCAPCVVPPTRACALASRRLEVLPCGGGTPLSQGLATAIRVADMAKKRGGVGKSPLASRTRKVGSRHGFINSKPIQCRNHPWAGGTPCDYVEPPHPRALQLRNCLTTSGGRPCAGSTLIVLITDGRTNVPLALSSSTDEGRHRAESHAEEIVVSASKRAVQEEALQMARLVRATGIDMIVIDTESNFMTKGIARKLAEAARGVYYPLPVSAALRMAPMQVVHAAKSMQT